MHAVAERQSTTSEQEVAAPPDRRSAPVRRLVDPVEQRRIVARRCAEHELLGRTSTPTPSQRHVAYSLAQWQTPVKDQRDRATSAAFAGIGAMEAAYRRSYGLDLELSVQYLVQTMALGEVRDPRKRPPGAPDSRCTHADQPDASGVLAALSRIAVPLAALAPYLDRDGLESVRVADPTIGRLDDAATQRDVDRFELAAGNIDVAARRNARYRVTGWRQLPDVDPATLENSILAEHEVVLDVDLRWARPTDGDVMQYDPESLGGGHTLLVVGFDRTAQYFKVKNSFGDGNLTKVSYELIRRCALAGSFVTGVADPDDRPQAAAWWVGRWVLDHDGRRGELTIRRFTDLTNADPTAPIKVGDHRGPDGSVRDVYGHVVDDGRGLVFRIAEPGERSAPADLSGDVLRMWTYTWDADHAAGVGTAGGVELGASMERASATTRIPLWCCGTTIDASAWLGTWDLVHDGWRGELRLGALDHTGAASGTAISGSYIAADGRHAAAIGVVDVHHPQVATLTIDCGTSTRRFDLRMFTSEFGTFAGTTSWGGSTFGLHGHRR